jgi:hypothetical protein
MYRCSAGAESFFCLRNGPVSAEIRRTMKLEILSPELPNLVAKAFKVK